MGWRGLPRPEGGRWVAGHIMGWRALVPPGGVLWDEEDAPQRAGGEASGYYGMAGPAAAGVGREYDGMAPFPVRWNRATVMGWLYLRAGLPPWEVLWDVSGRRRGFCGMPGEGCNPSQASWRCPPGPPRGAPVRPQPPLPSSVGTNKVGRVLWDGAGVGWGGWLPWCVSRGWLLWDGVVFVNYYGMRGGATRAPPPLGAARREDGNAGMRRARGRGRGGLVAANCTWAP